jgi:SNF2 family DNA or RNA helicase
MRPFLLPNLTLEQLALEVSNDLLNQIVEPYNLKVGMGRLSYQPSFIFVFGREVWVRFEADYLCHLNQTDAGIEIVELLNGNPLADKTNGDLTEKKLVAIEAFRKRYTKKEDFDKSFIASPLKWNHEPPSKEFSKMHQHFSSKSGDKRLFFILITFLADHDRHVQYFLNSILKNAQVDPKVNIDDKRKLKDLYNNNESVNFAGFDNFGYYSSYYLNEKSKNTQAAEYLVTYQTDAVLFALEWLCANITIPSFYTSGNPFTLLNLIKLYNNDAELTKVNLWDAKYRVIEKSVIGYLYNKKFEQPDSYVAQYFFVLAHKNQIKDGTNKAMDQAIVDSFIKAPKYYDGIGHRLGLILVDLLFLQGDTEKLELIDKASNLTAVKYVAQLAKYCIQGQHDKVLAALPAVCSELKLAYKKDGKSPYKANTIAFALYFSSFAQSISKPKFELLFKEVNAAKCDATQLIKLDQAMQLVLEDQFNKSSIALLEFEKCNHISNVPGLIIMSWAGLTKNINAEGMFLNWKTLGSSDFGFMQWQTANMIEQLKPENVLTKSLYDKALKMGWGQSIALFRKQVAVWETGLNKLLCLSDTHVDSGMTRLVWILEPKSGNLEFYEQKRGTKGWSPGRIINSYEAQRMAPNDLFDKKALQGISQTDDYHYSRTFKLGAIAPYLTGNPRIFLGTNTGPLVKISKAELPLQVKQLTDGNFEIGFQFDFDETNDGIIRRETPTKYLCIELTENHKRVREILGESRLVIPAEAKEQLTKVVEHLGSIMEVQAASNELDTKLKELPTDSRIYVHIVQTGSSYLLECFTKPIKEIGTYCIPGEGEPNLFGLLSDQSRAYGVRNLKQEQKGFKKVLDALVSLKDKKKGQNVFVLPDLEDCLSIMLELQPLVTAEEVFVEWPRGNALKIKSVVSYSKFNLSIKEKNNWFELSGSVKLDEDRVLTLHEMLDQLETSGRFLQLKTGEYIAITEALSRSLKQLKDLAQRNGKGKDAPLVLHPLTANSAGDMLSEFENLELDAKWKDLIKRIKSTEKKEYILPDNINAELRNYQVDGFKWLSRVADWGAGACLADDMGLGKTLQVQALLSSRAANGPALVVAPASVVRNWVNEINKFTPTLIPILYNETEREAALSQLGPYQVLIVTYNLLQRQQEQFEGMTFDTIVLDEAQAIKNSKTKRSEVVRNLKSNFRIIVTGTPIENHLGEFWSLFDFINPGLLGSDNYFAQNYMSAIEKDRDEIKRDSLKKLVQPFILRRLKKDYLQDLPAKTEIVLTVEQTPAERAYYEALRRKAVENIENLANMPPGQKSLQVLAELTRLRQACCNPRMVNPELDIPSAKLNQFLEIVDELRENDHRPLVFSQFVTHLKLLREALDEKGINYQYLDGSTPIKKRQEAIDAFQKGEGDLFLISLKAGGSGINLTAADYIIHMDPWWNPAVEDQATDRAHRMGQTKPVTVYRIIASNTIEEKIIKLHEHKRDLAEQLLSGTDVSAKMGTAELVALLNG